MGANHAMDRSSQQEKVKNSSYGADGSLKDLVLCFSYLEPPATALILSFNHRKNEMNLEYWLMSKRFILD